MVMHGDIRLLAVIALVVTAGFGVLRRQRHARVEATWLGTAAPVRWPGPGALVQAPALAAIVAALLVSVSVRGELPASSTGGQVIVFALDVSRSMDVADAVPSRASACVA